MSVVKDMTLLERADAPAAPLAPVAVEAASVMQMIERLAANPAFDAGKLEKLIDLQMRVTDHQAKAAFDAAFPAMQAAIPTIRERGSTNNGTYALLEDIIEGVRPILKEHGFSLSFRTEWPQTDLVAVVGVLTHRDGHSRESVFQSKADNSGNKNSVQALGSVVSYGQRYTTKDLLGIVTRGGDDDGEGAGLKDKPKAEAPKNFEEWHTDIQAVCDNGYRAFAQAWNDSGQAYRDYLIVCDRNGLNKLKAKANKADADRKAAQKGAQR